MIQSVKKWKYPVTDEVCLLKMTLTDGTISDVPLDELNKDYKAIQEWVAEGNVIEEAD
tara:strand:- start:512 stop:685 length:174 start_codon:yes stop_codon:yes gene_type:complete